MKGSRASISAPHVGSRPVEAGHAGRGALVHITGTEAVGAEQISYANFSTRSGCDLLVRKNVAYVFRLIYPRCGWGPAAELPPMYREIAEAWLKLRRRGTV